MREEICVDIDDDLLDYFNSAVSEYEEFRDKLSEIKMSKTGVGVETHPSLGGELLCISGYDKNQVEDVLDELQDSIDSDIGSRIVNKFRKRMRYEEEM